MKTFSTVSPAPEATHCVLLVEDNPGDALLLREYLSESDGATFEIVTVNRLSEAMSRLRSRDFDIVLLDLSLPDAHGLDTFVTLSREAPDVPIVVLTGLDDNALALRAVQLGAQDYLIKGHVSEATLPRSLSYAIERHRMQSQLKTLSLVDELTGLLNRRGFLTLAAQQLKSVAREGHGMAIFYVDLDGMKQINDNFGHHEGDWALTTTAEVLRQTFREADVLARLGGDEFTVLTTLRSSEDIEIITQRLQGNVDRINAHQPRPYRLQISAGAVPFDPRQISDIHDLLTRADKVLYQAKREKQRTPNPA